MPSSILKSNTTLRQPLSFVDGEKSGRSTAVSPELGGFFGKTLALSNSHLLAYQWAGRATGAHGFCPRLPGVYKQGASAVSRVQQQPIDNQPPPETEENSTTLASATRIQKFLQAKRSRSKASEMRIPVAFFLAFALLAAVAQSSGRHHRHHHHHAHAKAGGHGEGSGGGGGGELASARARAWPCCDSCGGCTKSAPARCQCLDAAPRGCHPACRYCVRSSLSVDPPVYQCMDRVPNFCQRRCTPVVAG